MSVQIRQNSRPNMIYITYKKNHLFIMNSVIFQYRDKIKEFNKTIIDKKLNDLGDNLDKYLDVVTTTLKYNLFLHFYPSLVSKSIFNIYKANSDYDYFYEKDFEDYAYVVKWTFTEQGCVDCSCLNTYPFSKTCSASDGPKLLNNGLVACQPQCFVNAQYNNYNPLYGTWSGTTCIRRDTELLKFFTDASMRSNPTGRDKYSMKIKFPDSSREIEVHVDDTYCKQFGLVYDSTKGSCETTNNNLSYTISFLTGESILKIYRLGENQMSSITDRMIQWASRTTGSVTEYTEIKDHKQALSEWMAVNNDSVSDLTLQIPFRFSTYESHTTSIKINVTNRPDINDISPISPNNNNNKNTQSAKNDSVSLRYKVDTLGQFIIDSSPEVGAAVVIDQTTNELRRKIVELEPLIKRLAPTVTQKPIDSVVSKIITNASIRQMAKTSAISSMSMATRMAAGTLRMGNIVMAVGGILDIAFTFLWDPINLTQRPLDDEIIKHTIQETTAKNKFSIELTPEIAWDEYYGRDIIIDEEQCSLTYLKAAFAYVKHRKIDHDIVIVSDDNLINFNLGNDIKHLPLADTKLKKIKYTTIHHCILSACFYSVAPYNITIYLLTILIFCIATLGIRTAVKEYFSGNRYIMNNIAYII